jgi:S-adenosylmethionine uptake transporter
VTASPPAARVLAGAAWMGLTVVSFVGVAVAAREMSDTLAVLEILFLRSAVGLLVLVPAMLVTGGSFHTDRPGLHVTRNLVHFAGQYGWTLGVVLLPLAEVFALEFTTPVWVALLAVPLLGERLTPSRMVAVLGGFAGILVILRPGIAVVDPGSFVVLGAALCFAASIIMVKWLIRSERPLTILFFMCLVQLPVGLVLCLPEWVWPAWRDVPWIVIYGVGSLVAHLGMAKAFQVADATTMIPIDFLRMPAIALIGYALYGEALSIWILVGAALIFGANYYSLRVEVRRWRALRPSA